MVNIKTNLEKMLQAEREIEAAARDIAEEEAGGSDFRDTGERVDYVERRTARLIAKYRGQR